MGVTNSRWGKEKCFDRDSFYQWVGENELTNEVTIKEAKEDEILPLKKKYVAVDKTGLTVSANWGESISFEKKEHAVKIVYDTEPHFYMALARSLVAKEGTYTIHPQIERFGIMWDCSRNAVPKIETVKRQICSMVLAGYNYLELYTEDTYEIPGEAYFGYKRGRYSQEELKEIVAFADLFKLEMVPCIQVLAHLKNLANWKPYYDHMDIDDILLVDDERTYALIRKMLTFCKETFRTDRINIGSDEAFHLGRGKYTDEFGYRPKHEVYLKHMKKVFSICKELGLKPEFWADAFYDTNQPAEEIRSIFDGEQTPIYWDYYSTEKEYHTQKLQKLAEYIGKVSYAGGLWTWIGYAPDNAFSDKVTNVAFDASLECGVNDILMTAWGDNGGECSIFAVMPAMWYAASKIYSIDVDYNLLMEELTGYTEAEWRFCDELNTVMPQVERMSNSVKYLLSNDYLVGLLDANIPEHAGKRYAELYPQFRALAKKRSPYAYIFKVYAAMCKVLIRKATYSKRLYQTYWTTNQGVNVKHFGDLEDYSKCEAVYYCEENKTFISLDDECNASKRVDGETVSNMGTYSIRKTMLSLKIGENTEEFEYVYTALTDRHGNRYVRLKETKVTFYSGFLNGKVLETVEVTPENGFKVLKPEDPQDDKRTFLCWKTAENKEYDFDNVVTGATELYASWEGEEVWEAVGAVVKNNTPMLITIAVSIFLVASTMVGIVLIGRRKRDDKSKEKDK